MGRNIRRRVVACWKQLAAAVLLCTLAISIVQPVRADPPAEPKKPIEHLVVVTDTPWVKEELVAALKSETGANSDNYGKVDEKDHRFVNWSNDGSQLKSIVSSAVTELRGTFPDSDTAVVFWMGWGQVNDVITFTHEVLNKKELPDKLKDKVQESYIEWVDKRDPDTGEVVLDPETNTPVRIPETKYRWVTENSDEYQFEWETDVETHHNKAAVRYSQLMESSGLRDWLRDSKIQEYWIGLPPNGVLLNGDVYDGMTHLGSAYTSDSRLPDEVLIGGNENTEKEPIDKDKSELYGFWAYKWNSALSSAGSVINIWDEAAASKLYYKGPNAYHWVGDDYHGSSACYQKELSSGEWVGYPTDDLNRPELPDDSANEIEFETRVGDFEYNAADAAKSGRNAFKFYSYADESYQQLFHIILETVQMKNPLPASEDPIPQDMYSISTALSAYVSNTLSVNASDETHTLPAVGNPGNAGALLGYGDKDKGFTEGIIANLSKTSSVVAYTALDTNATRDALLYAQYGRLLSQMGLDEYGIKGSGLSVRNVTGSMMLVVFVLSLVAAKLFGWFVNLLVLLNPFRFFLGTSGTTILEQTISDLDDSFLSHSLQAVADSHVFQNMSNLMSAIYNILNNWSWTFVVPLSLAVLILGIFFGSGLMTGRFDKQRAQHRILSFVIRIAFLAVGVPLLGLLYTHTLTYFVTEAEDIHSPATQVVASTFLDFGAWAEHSRLSPAGGKFEAIVSDSNLGGDATGDTVAFLRDTVLTLNKQNGVVNQDIQQIAGGDDVRDWNDNALNTTQTLDDESITQCFSLLTRYLNGSFYYPSSWEGAVGQAMHKQVLYDGYDSGRRKGGELDNADIEDIQGENTYYNMYDALNEMSDWTSRTAAENSNLFMNSQKWNGFNLLSNGTMTGNQIDNVITYSDAGANFSSDDNLAGTYPKNKGGLSSLSLYNYLSSKFSTDGIVMYSNSKTANVASRYSHYAVTSAGSGVTGALYFANGFVLLMLVAIVGMCYLMGAVFHILKKGVQMMASLPAAAFGTMKSIATIIATIMSMIAEILMIGFLYTMVIQLLAASMSVIEAVVDAIGSGQAVITADLFGKAVSLPVGIVCMALVASTMLLLVCAVFFWHYQRAGRRLMYHVCDCVLEWTVPELAVAADTQTVHAKKTMVTPEYFGNFLIPSDVFVHGTFMKSCKEWLAFVCDLLYTKHADESLVLLTSSGQITGCPMPGMSSPPF